MFTSVLYFDIVKIYRHINPGEYTVIRYYVVIDHQGMWTKFPSGIEIKFGFQSLFIQSIKTPFTVINYIQFYYIVCPEFV